MTIELKKFGTTLTSRQAGKEALLAYEPILKNIGSNETVIIDFDGVNTFSPSLGDKFLVPLLERFGKGMSLKKSDNLSVKATLKILEETRGIHFSIVHGTKNRR